MKKLIEWLKNRLSILNGWDVQSTKSGFNGDIFADDTVLMISHTNLKFDAPSDTWKDNRVEIGKTISKKPYNWYAKVKFHHLPEINEWVIFSQLWNKKHDNVLCFALNKSKSTIEICLNQKQNKITKNLWKGKFNIHDEIVIDLDVTGDSVSGFVNGHDVGYHELEVFTEYNQYIKHGFYWSEKIPYNNKSTMIAEYDFR